MNESDRTVTILRYLDEVAEQFNSGHAIEHAYRPALKALMSTFDDTIAVNDPKHSEHGAPDFIFLKKSHDKIIKGYAEAKDITVSLDKTEKTNQMQRYGGYANLFLTDYLEFRFFRNGEKYKTISLGEVKAGALRLTSENGESLMRELEAFLDQTPEKIRNGKRLAQIMGGKARRIRDNVSEYLVHDDIKSGELSKIYEMMTKLLVHDLEPQKFADMYAQTLVYGLFVARYGDSSPDNFTRSEARDLVPKSNPFLQHFFDHIVGPNFDTRLGYIVDELCEIFSVSNVQEIVHKHLRIQDDVSDSKDPIIHFYEDFLQEYDPDERKKMGAYYTPIPVVKYIVRSVDKILKEEFGVAKGLASSDTVDHWIETGQDMRADKRQKAKTGYNVKLPRVQVLDPAVGTATFLNETIKFIHGQFNGQEGRWPAYVKDNLVKRLHGFELMMAPYTIAHLKLGMTLKETGVDTLTDRLGVYLTNTLEEGTPIQSDLFSFGLAEAVSEESRHAAEIKSNHPIMIVMGNPPYSVSSNNKSKYIERLIADYKKDLNERNIQPLSDDYIKFIRFAEDMISKNDEGIVAMITNNSYIDGLIHRQMRKHLLQTFDKIYVLDLHGNSKKKEVAPDGSKDVNVFEIQQGVGIILGVKTGRKQAVELGEVYHAELYGTRKFKFDELTQNTVTFNKVDVAAPNYYFLHKDRLLESSYSEGIQINVLFNSQSSGITTSNDAKLVSREAHNEPIGMDIDYSYKPFDSRHLDYCEEIARPRRGFTENFFKENTALAIMRRPVNSALPPVFISRNMIDKNYFGFQSYAFPIYVYHDDGTRSPNFVPNQIAKLTVSLSIEPSPEDIFDYIYAILHSSNYRTKYKDFLKTDFPRVPIPTQADFSRLVPLGRQLRELHLMKLPAIDDYATTFPEGGDNVVEKINYDNEKVWINGTQYFGNVPETVWNFYIGGYQPAQRWLKDRKDQSLNGEELDYYQKIIKILVETDKIIKQIDKP